jgi:hypothetical protein
VEHPNRNKAGIIKNNFFICGLSYEIRNNVCLYESYTLLLERY